MTIWQIIALAIGGPIILWNLVVVGHLFINKRGTYTLGWAIIGVLSAIAILISFLGVK